MSAGVAVRGPKMVYLVSSLDEYGLGTWVSLRARIVHELTFLGVGVYRPHMAFKLPSGWTLSPRSVVDVNITALQACDGLLALLPLGASQTGDVLMKLQQAASLALPVRVVTDAVGRGVGGFMVQGGPDHVHPEQWHRAVNELCQLMRGVPDMGDASDVEG